jgi:hypothetical protein
MIFGPDGRYVGTIAGDRLVHRSTDCSDQLTVCPVKARRISPSESGR